MRFLLSTAVVVATTAGVVAHVAAPVPGPGNGGMELIASVKHAVSVTSTPVTGLYPGASKALTVRIKNTYAYPVKVTSVTTNLAATTTRPGCAGTRTNLVVSRRGGAIAIASGKSANVVMTVVMPTTVVDACQGATFKLTFTAQAVRG